MSFAGTKSFITNQLEEAGCLHHWYNSQVYNLVKKNSFATSFPLIIIYYWPGNYGVYGLKLVQVAWAYDSGGDYLVVNTSWFHSSIPQNQQQTNDTKTTQGKENPRAER